MSVWRDGTIAVLVRGQQRQRAIPLEEQLAVVKPLATEPQPCTGAWAPAAQPQPLVPQPPVQAAPVPTAAGLATKVAEPRVIWQGLLPRYGGC